MKIAIISDTHFGGSRYSKTDHSNGLNRFITKQFETMEWIQKQLLDKGITTIIHGGDLFDYHQVTVNTLYTVRDLLAPFDVYAVKGNHDDSSFLHEHEISALDLVNINHVYNTPGNEIIGGVNFVFSPWGYEIEEQRIKKDMKNVLVAHGYPKQYITAYKNDNEESYRSHNEGGVLSSKSELFDLIITGHYHIADEFSVKNAKYLNPGSISSFADCKDHRPSYWILDTDDLSYERFYIDEDHTTIIHTIDTDDPDAILDKIKSEGKEHIYRIKTDRVPDRKKFLRASKVALDIQLKTDIKTDKEKSVSIDEFWDYVDKKKPTYSKEFKKKLEEK